MAQTSGRMHYIGIRYRLPSAAQVLQLLLLLSMPMQTTLWGIFQRCYAAYEGKRSGYDVIMVMSDQQKVLVLRRQRRPWTSSNCRVVENFNFQKYTYSTARVKLQILFNDDSTLTSREVQQIISGNRQTGSCAVPVLKLNNIWIKHYLNRMQTVWRGQKYRWKFTLSDLEVNQTWACKVSETCIIRPN